MFRKWATFHAAIAMLVLALSAAADASQTASRSYTVRVATAASAAVGMPTRGIKGAPFGRECIAAIQRILDIAGLKEIAAGTLGVEKFEAALLRAGFERVPRWRAVPGDFVILSDAAGPTHAGICLAPRCSRMISNSSHRGTFSWIGSPERENVLSARSDGYEPSEVTFLHAST
jgi:hypothetical protein